MLHGLGQNQEQKPGAGQWVSSAGGLSRVLQLT